MRLSSDHILTSHVGNRSFPWYAGLSVVSPASGEENQPLARLSGRVNKVECSSAA